MSTKATILVVDDEPLNLALLSRLLNPGYRVLGTRSGTGALTLLNTEKPDLILLDVMMPEMDGFDVLARIQEDPEFASVPVIFVTALSDDIDEEYGLHLGAVDYIVKPIKPSVLLARVRLHLELKRAREQLARQNEWLETELTRRMGEIQVAQDLTLSAMAELAETRDNETGHHIMRTQSFVEVLARHLQPQEPFRRQLQEGSLMRIVKAAPMHDIGKIGIRDAILLKPGRLTPEEFEVMKTHAGIGGHVIAQAIAKTLRRHPGAEERPTESLRFLEVARVIAQHHHEKWDGSGYPDGLAGDAIPLPARLMAVADVYDALTTPRVYKRPWSHAEATAFIVGESGRHFDPRIVEAFVTLQHRFEAIARELADPDPCADGGAPGASA